MLDALRTPNRDDLRSAHAGNRHKISRYVTTYEPPSGRRDSDSGSVLVFSARSSRLFKLDRGTFEDLRAERFDRIESQIFETLSEAFVIVPFEEDEFATVVHENYVATRNLSHLYFVVQPTAGCQLGCVYCGQTHSKKALAEPDGDALAGIFSQALATGRYVSAEIAWFGGEPLIRLKDILALSSKLIYIAKLAGVEYSAKLVTNGLLLTREALRTVEEDCRVDHIEITLDGIAATHNLTRPFKTGRGSFDRIVDNLRVAASLKRPATKLVVRSNVTSSNAAGIFALIDLLAGMGLQDKISFYPAPVHDWGNDADALGVERDDYAALEAAIYAHLVKSRFAASVLPARRNTVCLAVREDSFVFDAYGMVHKCTETPYVKKYESSGGYLAAPQLAGASFESLRASRTLLGDALERPEAISSACQACKIFPVCGGACPKQWLDGKTPCPPLKKNIRDKMALSFLREFPLETTP